MTRIDDIRCRKGWEHARSDPGLFSLTIAAKSRLFEDSAGFPGPRLPPRTLFEGITCALRSDQIWLNGAAQESNLPSVGLRRRTGFEDQGRCVGALIFSAL
jgi:hypothetical protein